MEGSTEGVCSGSSAVLEPHSVEPVKAAGRPKPIRLRMQQPQTIRLAPAPCADSRGTCLHLGRVVER
jgi:hypothetical protein